MQKTWIVAADSNRARIFELSSDDSLREIEDMYNPEGRESEREQTSDARGRFGQGAQGGRGGAGDAVSPGGHGQAHTAEPEQSAREHDVAMFSKQLVRYLDQARNEQRFDKLRVIAAPKFLGLIRQNMTKEVQKMVESEIPKEIAGLDSNAMEQYLRQLPH
jgi:protein required for attachment to host cells